MVSVFKIKGKEFECNFTSLEFARRLDKAVDDLSKELSSKGLSSKEQSSEEPSSEELSSEQTDKSTKYPGTKYPEIIRAGCEIYSKFLDTVFGEGTCESLFKEKDLLEMESVLFEFLEFMACEQERIAKQRAELMLKYRPILD
jgi:hypothetical protein